MHIALSDLGVTFQPEVDLPVHFPGRLVGKYRADLIAEEKVIIEIKTAPRIVEAHTDQLFGYLKISGLQVRLLLNFGPRVEFERLFHSPGNSVPDATPDSTLTNPARDAVNS